MKKLVTADVLEYLKNGATLSKIYCVYSYWELKTIDGLRITNIRKGSCESVKYNNKANLIIFNQDKNGYSLKFI
jgi:hypothetical protein